MEPNMVTAALVVMTILGCDDSVSQCHYVDTVKGSWETVAACDSHSQEKLPSYTNASYPVIVAMCEKTGDAPIATAAQSDRPTPPAAPPAPTAGSLPAPGAPSAASVPSPASTRPAPLPQRAYALIRGVLPDRQKIQQVIVAPVHYLGDGYSWVATRLKR
jgi:hypothetical protein